MARDNTEPYLSKYLHQKSRLLGIPVNGTFELTARCNFDCPMCYVHLKQNDIDARGRELTAEQWIQIAREARDQGMMFVLLTGGEPFVRKDFFEIYEEMKKLGLIIAINSNGSMLKGEIRDRLLENPPSRINISLYGGCRDTYRNMCGLDMFDQVLENICRLQDAGVEVAVNYSITPNNCGDMERIHEISRERNLNVKATSYMFPAVRVNGRFGESNRLSPEESAQWMVRWEQLRLPEDAFLHKAEQMRQFLNADSGTCPLDAEEGVRCRAGSCAFWITWDGKMRPCGMMQHPTAYPMEEGFSGAWERLRRETGEIRLPAKCTACEKKEVCGVCAASCYAETGHFDRVPEYVCRQTDATIEKMWQAYLQRKG